MPRPVELRYPWAPVAARIAGRTPEAPNVTHNELAGRMGVKVATLRQWVSRGVPERRADALAVAVGLHPSLLWPDWWDEGLRLERERRERRRAATSRYQRRNPEKVKAWKRAYAERHAEAIRLRDLERRRANREARLAYRRAYYLANAEREKARQREYDRAKALATRQCTLTGQQAVGLG